TTTHKTLRGPRGGLILCKEKIASLIDKAVFPGLQGGPHPHSLAAKAVCFQEALQPAFRQYAKQIKKNAAALCKALLKRNFTIVFGSTENHLLLIDLTNKNISGRQAQDSLEKVGLIVNKNVIPEDTRKPLDPSGIRLGTPAVTTRGLKEEHMEMIAQWIDEVIQNSNDDTKLTQIHRQVQKLAQQFPIYKELNY
ncbi:MAG: aminotransferase class I/II-fold pyridoxal phosphate-dependent enzyme, partial [Candidatus Woesearchaeota archaeon]|nr:aminotransferase class I/II-fold pyridoxal phosphate-dependent enzyme [Candidatus Woesearchaeota archaeon]